MSEYHYTKPNTGNPRIDAALERIGAGVEKAEHKRQKHLMRWYPRPPLKQGVDDER